MLDFLELEETVGRAWHRLVGNTGTWRRHPEQVVRLEDVRPMLAVCFRGFGGEGAVQIAPARGRTSAHRLRLRQRGRVGGRRNGDAAARGGPASFYVRSNYCEIFP